MENIEPQPERLDSYSKILLATASINYLAHQVFQVNEACKNLFDPKGMLSEGIEAKNQLLQETVTKLTAIVEDLANYTNETDITQHIDERVLNEPLRVLIFNEDEVEKHYDEDPVIVDPST